MIVPMLRYQFVAYHREADGLLQELQDLGVVHVVPSGEDSDEEIENLASRIREAESMTRKLAKRKIKRGVADPDPTDDVAGLLLLKKAAAFEAELEALRRGRIQLQKNIDLLEPWGDIPWDRIGRLKYAGISTAFFQCRERVFDPEWEREMALEIINRKKGQVYFILFFQHTIPDLPVMALNLPHIPLSTCRDGLATCLAREFSLKNRLDDYANRHLSELRERIVLAGDELAYRNLLRNIEVMEDHRVVIMEGWCPEERSEELEKLLGARGVMVIRAEPDGEPAPVLLRNNRFTRLFEPIGRLFSLPAYSEMDLTAYFAPFFLLFFGFCLGDAGYGLILLIAATLVRRKIEPSYKPLAILIQLFGLSTIVLGIVSGTFFGIELIKASPLEPVRQIFMTQDQLFQAALVIGFIQILFGNILQAYRLWRDKGLTHACSKAGWGLLMIGLGDALVTHWMGGVAIVLIAAGTGAVILFGNPTKGWVNSILSGLADLYNITGIMGDLLSYIRLFALGVSSAILGLVVNSIALSAKGIPYVGLILFLLILVIGHTGNLLLSSLSAFVHPMRLTFVEFYKNAGFSGGGRPYKPFEKKIRNYRAMKGY